MQPDCENRCRQATNAGHNFNGQHGESQLGCSTVQPALATSWEKPGPLVFLYSSAQTRKLDSCTNLH
jgi:hypothetical protein